MRSYKDKIKTVAAKLKNTKADAMKLWKNTQNNGVYTLLYEVNGKRKRQSLFTKDKQLAEQTLAQLGSGMRYGESERASLIAIHEANLDDKAKRRTWHDAHEACQIIKRLVSDFSGVQIQVLKIA